MRVAILVPDFAEYSGDARVAQLQAIELHRKGHDVSIFALAASMRQEDAIALYILGMPKGLLWQRIYRLLFPLNPLLILKWVPKLRRADLVIAHLYPMTWLGYLAGKLFKTKYVFWFHGIEDCRLFPKLHERVYMRLHLALTVFTTKNADSIVSVSHFAKKSLKMLTGLNSSVIYNKVDLKRFHKDVDGQKMRRFYGLGNSPLLLFVGRLAPQKGIHLLIQAFGQVRKRYPTAKLMLAGDPTFEYYLKELTRMSDESVIFAGHVSTENMPYYYAMCDVYATCSLWENHNLPVLEAQACGKPIVAFDIEAFREVAGEGDFLVETGNLAKFSEACIQVIEKTRQVLA